MTLGGLYSIDRQHIDLTQDARLFFASAIAGQTLTTNKDARAICWDGYQYLQDDEKKGWGLFGRLGFSDGTHDPASGSKHGVMAAAGVNRAGKPIKP